MPLRMPAIAKPLDPMFRLAMRNHIQLVGFLDYVEAPERVVDLWGPKGDPIALFEEASRVTFNFAVSAVTFVDLVDKLFKTLPKATELQQLLEDYKCEKHRLFDNNPKYQVIDGLRHFLIHTELAEIGRVFHYDQASGFDHKMVIAKEQLVAGTGFNKKARSFIKSTQFGISVRELAGDCADELQVFHDWLWNKQHEIATNRHDFYL